MSAVLDRDKSDKLVKIAGMFGSAHAGERAAAALKFHEALAAEGVTLADVLRVAPALAVPSAFPCNAAAYHPSMFRADLLRSWQRKAQDILAQPELLDETETHFAQNMVRARREPTDKQRAWLDNLASRLRRAA